MTMEERIQELRKGRGLSQEQLADELNVSRQAVSKWESGQSLPEIEKLVAMSELFEVTIDYLLKGTSLPSQHQKPSGSGAMIGSQAVSAVAAMLLAIAVLATAGQLTDGSDTMDIYGGLIVESVGIMLMFVGLAISNGRIPSKPLFVGSILLAGMLPSVFLSQMILGLRSDAMALPLPRLIALSACIYLVLCGLTLYFTVIRKKRP